MSLSPAVLVLTRRLGAISALWEVPRKAADGPEAPGQLP